jgi:hypothetical protein
MQYYESTRTRPAQSYSPTAMKEAARSRRGIKAVSKGNNVYLGGSRGDTLNALIEQADSLLTAIRAQYAEWVNQKLTTLSSYLESITNSDIELVYKRGLATTLTQEYRVLRSSEGDQSAKLSDPRYVQNVITGYSFEFYRILRTAQRLDIAPHTALQLAQLSYHHNPETVIVSLKNIQRLTHTLLQQL